jgi:hypothetical protein
VLAGLCLDHGVYGKLLSRPGARQPEASQSGPEIGRRKVASSVGLAVSSSPALSAQPRSFNICTDRGLALARCSWVFVACARKFPYSNYFADSPLHASRLWRGWGS